MDRLMRSTYTGTLRQLLNPFALLAMILSAAGRPGCAFIFNGDAYGVLKEQKICGILHGFQGFCRPPPSVLSRDVDGNRRAAGKGKRPSLNIP